MTGFDVSAVDRALAELADKVRPKLVDALLETCLDIQEASDKDTPRLTGDLVNSSVVRVDTGTLVGGVGYLHASAPAAHENTQVRYKRGKKSKFLEDAVNANLDLLPQRVADVWRQVT